MRDLCLKWGFMECWMRNRWKDRGRHYICRRTNHWVRNCFKKKETGKIGKRENNYQQKWTYRGKWKVRNIKTHTLAKCLAITFRFSFYLPHKNKSSAYKRASNPHSLQSFPSPYSHLSSLHPYTHWRAKETCYNLSHTTFNFKTLALALFYSFAVKTTNIIHSQHLP